MAAPLTLPRPGIFPGFWAGLVIAIICAAAANERSLTAAQDTGIIQIDMRATVERVPDLAVVTLGVTGDASDSETALGRYSQNVLRILAAIREAGIPAGDVEQARPVVQPLYETWVEGNQERQGERIGYRTSTRITLRLHDMARAGSAIQAIVRAGATYIDKIAFRLNDDHQAAARAEARAAAIAKAERLARQAALAVGASGVHLIRAGEPPPIDGEADMAVLAEPPERGPPLVIEPGTIEIAEEIRATFGVIR